MTLTLLYLVPMISKSKKSAEEANYTSTVIQKAIKYVLKGLHFYLYMANGIWTGSSIALFYSYPTLLEDSKQFFMPHLFCYTNSCKHFILHPIAFYLTFTHIHTPMNTPESNLGFSVNILQARNLSISD